MSPRLAAILAVLGLSGILAGTGLYILGAGGGDDRFVQCRGSAVAGGMGTIGGPLTLVNAAGETVTDRDVFSEPSLVYFGYTFCPDVCPLDNARNAEAVDILAEQGRAATPVFISIDPERDTPEVVGDFALNFHDKMIGLTGSPEQIQAASQAYKTYYRAQGTLDEDPYYLVDHSTFTYLVLPGEGVVEFFRRDDSGADVAARTACFMDNA